MQINYDEHQLKAIKCLDRHSIIIAAAGSGKTTTILGKIDYLLTHKLCKEKEIICLSFTNETVKQLKIKLATMNYHEVQIFTFHKLAFSLLKNKHYKIIDHDYLDFCFQEFMITYVNKIDYLHQFFSLKKNNSEEVKKQIIRIVQYFLKQPKQVNDILMKKWNKHNLQLIIISIIFYYLYTKELASHQAIDYETLINISIKYVSDFKIKHLIVDEYQDISNNRFELIKKIVEKNKCILTVVGDDYQSIYQFSGSNLRLFTDFCSFFPAAEKIYLENTYRNSQELITKSIHFIQKNPLQMKKNVFSKKSLKQPIKIIPYFNRNKIMRLIKHIIENENRKEILFLGRNNFDFVNIFPNISIKKDGYFELAQFNNISLRFLTVHKAKGLEAEVTVIINVRNHLYGFPNKIKNTKIDNYFIQYECFPFAEERRLFYVALTRTKNECYLFVPIINPSIFIKEIC